MTLCLSFFFSFLVKALSGKRKIIFNKSIFPEKKGLHIKF